MSCRRGVRFSSIYMICAFICYTLRMAPIGRHFICAVPHAKFTCADSTRWLYARIESCAMVHLYADTAGYSSAGRSLPARLFLFACALAFCFRDALLRGSAQGNTGAIRAVRYGGDPLRSPPQMLFIARLWSPMPGHGLRSHGPLPVGTPRTFPYLIIE